ncbi:MAG: hypothetical protein PVJ15_00620 [Gammaproteobacteria bacterium]|jgi:hypothetical protein
MQHIHTPALHLEGHNTVWRAVKYLSLALAGLIAVIEHSPGLLIVVAIAFALVLALVERTRKLHSEPSLNTRAPAARLLGDGGCFPGAEPEKEHQASAPPSVLDGGIR